MAEPATYLEAVRETPLLQRAVAVGALSGLACALLSPFVVLRRMAFVGDGMAHAAFGGLGVGLFLFAGSTSEDPSVQGLTIAFCLVLAVLVARVSRRGGSGRISEDSAIGIAFSVSMALGALLITLRFRRDPQYSPQWEQYLFGNLLTVGESQVWITLGLTLAVVVVLLALFKELSFYTYDETLAELGGLPAGVLHYLFMLLLVLTVTLTARVIGVVLVSASLVLPGLAALAVSKRLGPALAWAGLLGVVSYEAGLYFSYAWRVPPGSAVILVQFCFVAVALTWAKLKRE